MQRIRWQDHVVIDPEVHHGDPCIRGTRVPVRTIVASLADGMETEALLASFPQLTAEDVQGALSYAAELMREETLIPLSAKAS